jgi:hypothetical protein
MSNHRHNEIEKKVLTENGISLKRMKAIEIIEIFEDFLNEKEVEIPNYEKEGEEDTAILYGTDYYSLEDKITKLLGGGEDE